MDFSRRGIIRKQHNVKSMTKRVTSKLRVFVFRVSIAVLVAAAIIGSFSLAGSIKGILDDAPDLGSIDITPDRYTSYIYYADGTVSQSLYDMLGNRVYAEIEEIPKHVLDCFIALEDERFYEHNGIDLYGIFRAVYSVLKEMELDYGASTITQQVLKNSVFSGGMESKNYDKIVRKIQEVFLAIQLENFVEKDEILEAYLNEINFSNNSSGIKMAAVNYFNKELKDLTLSEASVLAPIAYSPTFNNPLLYPDNNAERRAECLNNMLESGLCTQQQYQEAMEDNVYERIQEINSLKPEPNSSYTYYVDTVFTKVSQDLQEKYGMSLQQAQDLIYTGGISIYTPQDRQIQEIVDKYYTDEAYFPAVGNGSYYELNPSYAVSVRREDGTEEHYHLEDFYEYFSDYKDTDGKYYHENSWNKVGINRYTLDKEDLLEKMEEFQNHAAPGYPETEQRIVANDNISLQPQSSFVLMDQSTGEVAAVYGGRGEKHGARGLNRASDAKRLVGSTFKVLASFLPALDTAGFTLASVADDSEYTFPGETDPVRNWWTGGYRGLSPIRVAIADSMNIIACRIIEQVTPQVSFNYLKKLGFTSLVESRVGEDGKTYTDIGPALALGSMTDGVTNAELTAAFASIANNGYYNEPIYYTKVLDRNGNILLENRPLNNQIFKASTAYLLTDAMVDTTERGTGTRLRFKNYRIPVAGKTGTTTGDYDLWFVGYTPYYTAGVWTGFDFNLKQTGEAKTYHQELWRMIMEEVHETKQLEQKEFTKPDSIVTAEICVKCGNLAIKGICDHAEVHPEAKYRYPTRVEMFARGSVPVQQCTCHGIFKRCKVSLKLAGPNCPEEDTEEYVYLFKEEQMETWDTPYVYPQGEDAYCDVHTHSQFPDTLPSDAGEIGEDVSENGLLPEFDIPSMPDEDLWEVPDPEEDLWDAQDFDDSMQDALHPEDGGI